MMRSKLSGGSFAIVSRASPRTMSGLGWQCCRKLKCSGVLAIFTTLGRRYKKGIGRDTAPRGLFQNLFETLVVFVRDEIAKPNLGHKYERFMPYLLTAFFFILTCNLLGLVPFGATATSNLMVTAVLATFTFLLTQFNGSRDYWLHILWPPGVPTLVKPIMIPVEIVGIFTKPIALAIRLFANMTAGHLVILSLVGLIFTFRNLFGPAAGAGVSPVSVAFALFIYLLELLVAFIQTYVFTLLSALFIGMAVAEHHDHEHPAELSLEPVADDHSRVTPHIIPGTVAGQFDVEHPRPATAT
jgi:F-type H+-transporting ATPase subunit a